MRYSLSYKGIFLISEKDTFIHLEAYIKKNVLMLAKYSLKEGLAQIWVKEINSCCKRTKKGFPLWGLEFIIHVKTW